MQGKNRFISLTDSDREHLKEGYKNGKTATFRQRCHCILLSDQGRNINEIMEILGKSRQTIYSWFNRFEANGYAGLLRAPGGGRPTISRSRNRHLSKALRTFVNVQQNLRRSGRAASFQ